MPSSDQIVTELHPRLGDAAGAVFSADRRYRYRLWRKLSYPLVLAPEGPRMLFVMLNPSTAGALNDPTVTRCVGYALRERCSQVDVVNLFAFIATDPTDLWMQSAGDIIGGWTDWYLVDALAKLGPGGIVVCGWGAIERRIAERVKLADRVATVLQCIREAGHEASCLKRTKDGSPGHPLYLPGRAPIVPWAPGEVAGG